MLRLSRICSAGFSTVSSHLDTSVASRLYTAGTLSPGPTRTHTHTRVKHTQSGQRFHHLFIFSGLGEKSSRRQHFDKRDKKSLNNVFEFRFLTDSQHADEDKQHSYMLHANYAAEYWTFCMKQEGSGVGDVTSEGGELDVRLNPVQSG